MSYLLLDQEYQLQRMPGKGGWTFIEIREVVPGKTAWFNMLKTNGSIDAYEFTGQTIWKMKNGSMFMPVKAEIRKKISKEAGDTVRLILYAESEPAADAESEFLLCLQDEPDAFRRFNTLSADVRKAMIDWISSAKIDDHRVERMAESINRLLTQKVIK